MKNNTPIQSYHRSRVRPRPARSYRTRQFPRWLAGLLFIIFLILLLSLGGIAEILFGLQEPGPDSPSISYAEPEYYMHPNHEFVPVSRHQEVMTFEATAYTLEDGNGDGLTATMVRPQVGRTIAVDPAIIPYGSKVIVDGHTYVAEDTGGDIRGNRIDIYFGEGPEAYERAMEWGRRPVKMIVLPREE
jgi:3D (Asp-Asp-Asp) domain-containing protein